MVMGWDTTKQVVKGMTGISRLERRLENSYEESLYLRGRVKELESYQLGAVGPNDHLNLRNHHYYRGRARALDRSNDLARGAIDTLVSVHHRRGVDASAYVHGHVGERVGHIE